MALQGVSTSGRADGDPIEAQLDASYHALLSSDHNAHAAYNQATATYRAWLSSNRRG